MKNAKTKGKKNLEATSIRLAFSMGYFFFGAVEAIDAGSEVFLLLPLRREVKRVTDDLGRKLPFPAVPKGFCEKIISLC